MKKHSGVLNKILTVIGLLLCIVFGLMLIFNITIIVKGLIHPETPPSVFGVTPMVVKSGSMSSDVQHKIDRSEIVDMTEEQLNAVKVGDTVYTMSGEYKVENRIVSVNVLQSGDVFYLVERPAADHIEVGDLIFSKKTEPKDIKVGDVISFMENSSVVTHRVIGVNNENGKYSFVTKGDANNSEDIGDPVSEEALVGVYKSRVPMLGDFIYFLQKPLGMAIFIGVPVLAFIIFDIIRRSRNSKKEDTRTEELEKELERLRALAKEREEKAKEESSVVEPMETKD
ncbi:MAG: signal peptidase I [Clostridia bacterium]|nr:signal peptidase I [Clostridia bacterium]